MEILRCCMVVENETVDCILDCSVKIFIFKYL
jgi:hypothetical protein